MSERDEEERVDERAEEPASEAAAREVSGDAAVDAAVDAGEAEDAAEAARDAAVDDAVEAGERADGGAGEGGAGEGGAEAGGAEEGGAEEGGAAAEAGQGEGGDASEPEPEPEPEPESGGHGHGHGHGHGDSGGHGHGGEGATLRQLLIVTILVGALIALHKFGGTSSHANYDPTAMLALGFVVLASFTIGALVDVIKLPHITGYLAAGMIFGPSIAGFFGSLRLWPPFDEGVLHDEVIRQLRPLETLAVALIALTAGGELKLESLRRGLKAISGVLVVQLITVLALTTAFFWLVSGAIPAIALPGIGDVSAAVIPVGLTIGAISFATSPAATIAIINETGAKGAMTRTVLSAVVLKDVFVVVLFGVFSAWALASLGASSEGNLAAKLSIEILGSIGMGVALGGGVALYLRYVGQELMLFVLGVVYTGTYVAFQAHLDAVLVFLAAGFVVSNFSASGDRLIHTVEQLSMPVYVVFFTLAGAKLHLDEVVHLFAFALALVGVRILAIYLGVRAGAWVGGADEGTKKHGWMGFVSQAGVAIPLAGFVKTRFGEPGEALSSLLIAGVAINEIVGPVLLKVGLGLAGEIGEAEQEADAAEEDDDGDPEITVPKRAFDPWPEGVEAVDWGERADTDSPALNRQLRDLEIDLRGIVRDVADGPMTDFRGDAEHYLRDLRREFLRHHRRLMVKARGTSQPAEAEGAAEEAEADSNGVDMSARFELARALRSEQTELAERWRSLVLARAAQLAQKASWTPEAIVDALDDVVDALPERVEVPYDPRTFAARADDGFFRRVGRAGLRLRRGFARLFGRDLAPRPVALRDLARYHLEFETPSRLEGVAALFVQAEQHLAGRTRNLFDGVVQAYDALAAAADDPEVDLEVQLQGLREDVEEELLLAFDEVTRIARDGTARTGRILAQAYRAVKDEAPFYGTIDLPESERRSSRALSQRVEALEQLTDDLDTLRNSSAGEFALLAMELELVGLEAKVKDLLASHATRLEGEVERRVLLQAERVLDSLEEASQHVDGELSSADSGEEMAASIRQIAELTEKVAGEAARIIREMRDELLEENKVSPLLDALGEAAGSLTTRYEVSAGRLQKGEYKLPPAVGRVEVPFRDIVVEHIETRVAPQLLRVTREMAEQLQPLAASLKEVERLLAFNVELATSELEVVPPEELVPAETRALLREMISGQLERSDAMVQGYVEQAQEWPEDLGEGVRQAVLGALDELRGQLVDGKISRAKVEEMRRVASRRRLAQRAGQLPQLLRDAREQLTKAVVALVGEARLEIWRRRLGLPVPPEAAEVEPERFAVPSPQVELPLVYRRLFAADTMEAGDVLTGREEAISRARRALETKTKGGLRAVALVGLDGVGKASVSNAIVRGGRWKNVKRVTLTKPQTVESVEALLKETSDAQLVVLDGLFWMVSAKPGGFAPLRRFVDGLVADGGRRSWLVHAEALFWTYASTVAPLAEGFPEVVRLAPLTAEELTAAVMERHRLSGYGHAFDRLEGESKIEGLVARGASRIRRPFEQYFQDLHAATGGLVRDALRLWLASIRGIEGGDVVRVGHVPSSGYAALSRLPAETLLHLFQVARQGWMDADTLASLFRVAPAEARARLARLRHLGLLEEKDGVYRVALHLRGAVVRVVRDRGWLSW